MKEYKLSRKSKYSVFYLLSGLFMFFFMFAILNLSSYADVVTPINYNFNSLNYNGVEVPAFSYTISGTGHFTYVGAGGSSLTAQQYFYIVTDSGSINVANYVNTFHGTSRQDISFSYSGTCLGKPINAYVDADDLSGGYGVFVWDTLNLSVSVVDWGNFISGSGGSLLSNTGYHSFSPCKVSAPFTFYTGSTDSTRVGDDYCFFFDSYSSSNFSFTANNATHIFRPTNPNLCVTFSVPFGADASDFKLLFIEDGVSTTYTFSSFSSIGNINLAGGLYTLYQGSFVLPYKPNLSDLIVLGYGSCNVSMPKYYFSIFSYEASLTDYMYYVQQNWNDISPSVSDTNQNIAQSVSDIGTAQTFETGAFTDFDNSMTSSGLDTFSLSFDSTPLFWAAGIINTFYNNMPSGFQYLLMFVAFIGILVIVLNIAGRVVRRFGGE